MASISFDHHGSRNTVLLRMLKLFGGAEELVLTECAFLDVERRVAFNGSEILPRIVERSPWRQQRREESRLS